MPDGTTLAQAVKQHEQTEPQRKSRKQKNSKADRWERSFKLVRDRPTSQVEQTELDYLYRVGRERRRRFLNDKLLRDMAGPLTARDMESLFKPAPFGESNHSTPLQQILEPENATIWDLFRNIDFDKQNRLLKVHSPFPMMLLAHIRCAYLVKSMDCISAQKWEDKIKQGQQQKAASSSSEAAQRDQLGASAPADLSQEEAAFTALRKWAGTNKKCRQALRRANPTAVEELELHYLQFMSQVQQVVSVSVAALQRILRGDPCAIIDTEMFTWRLSSLNLLVTDHVRKM